MPDKISINHWDNLVEEWVKDSKLPLYIRKSGDKYLRGSEIIHKSGRILIPVDNGPAHWVFCMCINKKLINIKKVSNLIKKDKIPVAYILKKGEAKSSKYKCTEHSIDTPNKKGWKIAHKEPIGLNTRRKLKEIDINILERHFTKFMSPSNIFLVPLPYAGLAEIKEVIDIFNNK